MTGSLALLRSLVRGDVEALRHALSDPATDVAGFLGFARRHQLGAYVYRTLRQLGLISILPPEMVAGAKAASLIERALSERLAQEMHELGELFDRGDARVMFIKGPLFAQRFYGSLDARGLFDLDVLIQAPGDIETIEALLLEAGFERAYHVPASRRLGQYFAHHFEYRRESLPLDVHWALQRHFTFAIDYARIWATSTRIGLKGHTYEATSDEYELVLQILGVVTDLQVGRLKLRSLVDVYRILRTVEGTLDWGDFFSWRDRERILRASVYVLSVVLDVLDCRDEFPRLGTHLESTLPSLPPTDLAFRAVMQSRPFDLAQKLLALRLYDARLAASLSWWLVSLPFRLAVYGVTRWPHRRRA
jgi:putative nucleotidyltransferase-like protein